MKTLKEIINESLLLERNFTNPFSSEKEWKIERKFEEDRIQDLKNFLLEFADQNNYSTDYFKATDNFNELYEYKDIPVLIIGNHKDKSQICIGITIHTTGVDAYYYYKGICFSSSRKFLKYFSDLKSEYNDINIPDIPINWFNVSNRLQKKDLQLMKDKFIHIVGRAEKLQKKMRLFK